LARHLFVVMATTEFKLLGAFETHDVDENRAILDAG
jgi:hypothetical protein